MTGSHADERDGTATDGRADGEALLRIEDVWKSYGDEAVFRGIDLTIDRGDVEVLVGPSGSGKSTLLRCINRLTEIDRGAIYLDGLEVTSPDADPDELRQQVGMVFQDINLFAHLTARQNVTLGLRRVRGFGKRAARERADEELAKVGLGDQADSYPAQLSGGQKQRVGIARALAMDPKLVLFDEPTSALDPELSNSVLAVMERLVEEGMTMIVVTHEMRFARSAADGVTFLEGGRVVERGPPDRMFEEPERARTREFLQTLHG
ncbi:amino acid ABC transporter ATP-binding protein [Halovivax sp.]|uniref:amino acid ABC transporter ATP-binding protein n=1 Tax=Halovivax sp. TaxID=1935978 RepID=UPI0025BA81FF|nr:amino acid ABC transporter ATP-binding protein [Halovivax sp.]